MTHQNDTITTHQRLPKNNIKKVPESNTNYSGFSCFVLFFSRIFLSSSFFS